MHLIGVADPLAQFASKSRRGSQFASKSRRGSQFASKSRRGSQFRARLALGLFFCGYLVSLCAGCSSPAKIEVAPKTPMLRKKGASLRLKAVVKDSAGKVLSDTKVTFRPLTPTLLTVDDAGKVRATQSGAGAVLVSAGKITKKVEISIQIASRIAIDAGNPILNVGISRNAKATLYNDRGKPMLAARPVVWSTSDATIIKVTKEGMFKTLKDGTATITATAAGISGSAVVTVQHEKMQADGYLGHGSGKKGHGSGKK